MTAFCFFDRVKYIVVMKLKIDRLEELHLVCGEIPWLAGIRIHGIVHVEVVDLLSRRSWIENGEVAQVCPQHERARKCR